MTLLVFPGAAVLQMLSHAISAKEHTAGYSLAPNPGPGLLLFKDTGIYLKSNGLPSQIEERGQVVYADGFESPRLVRRNWAPFQREKIRTAGSRSDFVEFLSARLFDTLAREDFVHIELTSSEIRVIIVQTHEHTCIKATPAMIG